MKIRKAVIAVAGYGTRFLPATKVVAKELLPIVDKPIVQILVEEVVDSGIKDIILVTRSGTQAVADHFGSNPDLEEHLAKAGKRDYLDMVRNVTEMANFAFVPQGRDLPYGNGTPLLAARKYLNEGEPFVYLFGDDLVLSDTPCVKQLVDVYDQHEPDGVIAFQEVPNSQICLYAAAELRDANDPSEIMSLEEKPKCEEAASNLAQLGRFVLPWRVIEILEEMSRNIKGKEELYLTYANNQLCEEGRMLAHTINGRWLTTGDPLRHLQASVLYALRHERIGGDFADFLRDLDLPEGI
jgi:UTP--glucose-1-phosphate uridylyltransferase